MREMAAKLNDFLSAAHRAGPGPELDLEQRLG
jgi:hypothetical protein